MEITARVYHHRTSDLQKFRDKKTNVFGLDPQACLLNTCALLIMLVALLPLLFASSILATPLARQNTRQYNIYNKCPTAIDLYISGTNHGTIPTGGSVSRTLGTSAGYFFTDANGGSKNINRAIYAGFYEVNSDVSLTIDSEVDDSSGLLLHRFGPRACQYRSASEAQESYCCMFLHMHRCILLA
jgi:hypothetical protein